MLNEHISALGDRSLGHKRNQPIPVQIVIFVFNIDDFPIFSKS